MLVNKMRTYQILLFIFVFSLSNCITDEYDLSKDINTDVSVGGDSLAIPIGKTDTIFLGNMISGKDNSILQESDSGNYSLRIKDSTQVKIDAISPVSLTIAPISIAPIKSSFGDIKFPSFQINPITIETPLPIPDLTIQNKTINKIDARFPMSRNLSILPSFVKKSTIINRTNPSHSKTLNFNTGLITLSESKTIDQELHFVYPSQLSKINTIYLTNNRVTLTFDKTAINDLHFDTQNDTIKSFRIDFPAEFKLSSNEGMGTKIIGSSFIIENAILSKDQGIYRASFLIDKLDMSKYPQSNGNSNALDYVKSIPYSIEYSYQGETNLANLPENPKLQVSISLLAELEVGNMEIETKPFEVKIDPGTNEINQTVDNIPVEISEVKTLTFEDGANLDLNISDPGISPFKFSAGSCTINLPNFIVFKPYNGLNTSTNELTFPYSELFKKHSIGISGMKLNKTIVNQKIAISDLLKYNINGLTVDNTSSDLYTLQKITDKSFKVTSSFNGLNVKDASITTNSITIAIPTQNTNIDISQFVTKDVKKIYSVSLKTPSLLKFNINIKNLPSNIDSLFFRNYTIKLPSCLKFKDGDVNSNNEIILNRGFKVSEGFSKSLTLEKFDFGNSGFELDNGNFTLHEAVSMTGNAYIKGSDMKSSEIGNVEILPSISIGDMSLSIIEGKISPVIDPIKEDIKLDLPSSLKNEKNNLDIKNPVISLEIGNSMGIPIDVAINIVPKSKGVIIPNATITSPILHIAAATVLGKTTWSKFRLSKSFEFYPDGFTSIAIPNLTNLLKVIPDELSINVNPTIVGEKQIVDLYSKKNQLDLKYEVNVPLDFGADFNIQYVDTISDLKTKLRDVFKLSKSIEILAVVESKIPMNLAFNLKPLDTNNQEISGITINTDSILYDSKLPIVFGIKETELGALEKLDKFQVKISASKSVATSMIPIKSNDFLILELKVRIPKGLNIKQ